MRIVGTYGKWFDKVTVDGEELSAEASQAVQNHSPDGFAWGYSGSGPAQLALAILLAAGLRKDLAQALHQRFKAEHIAGLPQRGDWVLEIDVKAWALGAVEARRVAQPERTSSRIAELASDHIIGGRSFGGREWGGPRRKP